MTVYTVTFEARLPAATPEEAADILHHLERVLDELELLEETDPGLLELDLSAHLQAEGATTITVNVEAETGPAALNYAIHSVLRTAIHAADGATPGWEELFAERARFHPREEVVV